MSETVTTQEPQIVEIDGVQIDETTGEVMSEQGEDLKLRRLPSLGRAMRRVQDDIEFNDAYRRAEIERINGLCRLKDDRLRRHMKYLRQAAEAAFTQTGEKRLEYPGLGIYRYSKTRVTVDAETWDAMPADERDRIAKENATFFREKTTVAPDKKAILDYLSMDGKVPGFTLRGGDREFDFVVEKGN